MSTIRMHTDPGRLQGNIPPDLSPTDARHVGDLDLQLLRAEHVPAVLQLRNQVLGALTEPDLYVREYDEVGFVTQHCGPRGDTIGVFDQGQLVAYAMLGLPPVDDPDHLGEPLKLPHSAWPRVAYVASCMVLPSHRGQGLQRSLLAARFALAQTRGRDICVAMVSLHNSASRHNLLKEGMRVAWVGLVDGLKRQLMYIELARPLRFDLGPQAITHVVNHLDYTTQKTLTHQGYWGVAEQSPSADRAEQLIFAKRVF